jgi:hypothetical protein
MKKGAAGGLVKFMAGDALIGIERYVEGNGLQRLHSTGSS